MITEDRTERLIEQLDEIAQENPALADYCGLHQALLQLLAEAREDIRAALELADEEALRGRIQQGLPLLSFTQLPIEVGPFAELVASIASLLTERDPDLQGQALPEEPPDWLALAQERFEAGQVKLEGLEVGEPEDQAEQPQPTLSALAVDLALRPYLQWAADQVLPHVDLQRWKRAYCPVCGGAPDFAVLEDTAGARRLVCSRCLSEWPYRRLGCPYCGNSDYNDLFYYLSDDEVYRLYVCQECRHYLKAIDLRKANRRVLLEVERIASVAMDVAAREEGYR